jgi:hypothetical protein
MIRHAAPTVILSFLLSTSCLAAADADRGDWAQRAAKKPFMTAEETRVFMRRLAQYVFDNHLKRDAASPQRGMIYEYFRPARKDQLGQWIQGEALDTMHDGSWFAVAMVNAFRATNDPFYKQLLLEWQLPFYLRMLNHSDELFSGERNDARPGTESSWLSGSEWLLQKAEKGFVPYWWDDGASQSLEMLGKPDPLLNYPGTNAFAGRENSDRRLSGYSHGCSNHMAQDLAVMLQQTWLLFRESGKPREREILPQIASAARFLQESRARHGSAQIPACVAAAGLTNSEPALLARVAVEEPPRRGQVRNHFVTATVTFKPDQPAPVPGFADDQQYRYYTQLARTGSLREPTAWRTIFDALTEPQLYRLYSDDSPAPRGVSIFDLHPCKFLNGKPADLRSQRKGPHQGPRPIGSRFGPQNMICAGWALQAIAQSPGLWEKYLQELGPESLGLSALDDANRDRAAGFWNTSDGVAQWLRDELGGGLRTWEAVFDDYGYIPTGLGAGSATRGVSWDELSDSGGYAHLISAAAQWILVLEKKRDWELHRVPQN